MTALGKWLLERGHNLLLFPGVSGADDYVTRHYFQLLRTEAIAVPNERLRAPHVRTVDELIAQISGTDYVITSRYHGILLSVMLGKPVIALSYHPKDTSLMADMQQSEYCLSIDDFDLDSLKHLFSRLEENRHSIGATVLARSRVHGISLAQQYDRIAGLLTGYVS